MKVVVLGASGYLGSHAAQQLILAGIDVQCWVREGSDVSFLQSIAARLVSVDFNDLQKVEHFIDAQTVVINCIADTRSHASYEQRKIVEIDLTCRLFALAQRMKARRFIQLSTVMVYGFDRPATAIDETFPPAPRFIYNCIARDREQALQNLYRADGTELLILRPSNALGKRDTAFLPSFLQTHYLRVFPVVGGGGWQFSCIDARDVGRAMVHLLSVAISKPEIYLVKGFDLDWLGFKEELDSHMGKPSYVINLPKAMLLGMARLMEWVFPYGKNPLLTRFDVHVLSTDTLFDDTKIRATGFEAKYMLHDSLVDALGRKRR